MPGKWLSDPRWTARIGNPVTGQKMTATDEAAHRAATFAAMARAHIVMAVVSGDQPAALLRWKQAAPDKVIVGYGLDDPAAVDPAFLRAEHAAGRLEVIGARARGRCCRRPPPRPRPRPGRAPC